MRETGRDFADVLAEAQQLGYAEADPAFDIDGVDAAHKLALLSAVAFGSRVDFAGVYTEGISKIASMDIEYAEELGYRIKLLGIAEMNHDGIHQRVRPHRPWPATWWISPAGATHPPSACPPRPWPPRHHYRWTATPDPIMFA
jgi:homoserine dehydrogenase